MLLRDLANFQISFGEFDDYDFQDFTFFVTMALRVVEDIHLMAYTIARQSQEKTINLKTVEQVINLVSSVPLNMLRLNFQLKMIDSAFMNPTQVRGIVTAHGFPIQDDAIAQISSFGNYYLADGLENAAKTAKLENTKTVSLSHWLPYCQKWPYPLNRYC